MCGVDGSCVLILHAGSVGMYRTTTGGAGACDVRERKPDACGPGRSQLGVRVWGQSPLPPCIQPWHYATGASLVYV
jgi:hypothetical protein